MTHQSRLGWTPAARAAFLEQLTRCGIVVEAAAVVGLSAKSAYALRNRDPEFALAWDTARDVAREHVADTVFSHALEGWQEEVWYKGEKVGYRQRRDPYLLLRLLERLDRVTGNNGHERRHGANHIGKIIDSIAAEEPTAALYDPPEWEMRNALDRAERFQDWREADMWKEKLKPFEITNPPFCAMFSCEACATAEVDRDFYGIQPVVDVHGYVVGCKASPGDGVLPDDADGLDAETAPPEPAAGQDPCPAHPSPVKPHDPCPVRPEPAAGQCDSASVPAATHAPPAVAERNPHPPAPLLPCVTPATAPAAPDVPPSGDSVLAKWRASAHPDTTPDAAGGPSMGENGHGL